MYSGYIIHPVADLFKAYIRNLILPIESMIYPDTPSFVQYLKGIGELEEVSGNYIYIDHFLEYLLDYHMF